VRVRGFARTPPDQAAGNLPGAYRAIAPV